MARREVDVRNAGGPALNGTWEEASSFQDALSDWMGRAPWLGLSMAAHAMVLLVLALIPWKLLEASQPPLLRTAVEPLVEESFVDPPVELPPEIVETILDEEPTLLEEAVAEPLDDSTEQSEAPAEGDPDFRSTAPFAEMAMGAVLGLGGPPGGLYGSRFGNGRGRGRSGRGVEAHVARGLDWLARHQDADGKWDSDDFMAHDPASDVCDGPGQPEHDVGLTGLALLAFLGDGHTTARGEYTEHVLRGIRWLAEQQDPESGLFPEPIGHAYLYDHAIATLALCEAYYFSRNPLIGRRAQAAVGFITRSRNPYGVWGYDSPPTGRSDTSVTGWMVFALESAREAGLTVDSQAFHDSLAWLDEVTDTVGRIGYRTPGSASSRVDGVNDHYPTDRTECLTAVGLLCRFFLGQDPSRVEPMERGAALLARALPRWDPDGLSNDMYYWYYGSYAMYQMGGSHWRAWEKAMHEAVVASQRADGAAAGSWDPIGPWGFSGGRVYSTALGVLSLEVTFRYARVLGAR
ncbi:MAG: terpene cyclase/mutase family protein [Planctomycetota bacterium]|jgi:hypothetical protein|nr:terpene cyclase/mutase family protein [Planctomycetota bacterium]MDP6763035.1 terpene cyclase/mutase family protein [Planctomycetota bacterium]